MNQKQLQDRLYSFALKIIQLVRSLPRELAGYEIGKQLIRSGTSIAANYEEATAGFSKNDFIYKMSIAFKESKESRLWLKLLSDSGLVKPSTHVLELIRESDEIAKILARSLKTARMNSRS